MPQAKSSVSSVTAEVNFFQSLGQKLFATKNFSDVVFVVEHTQFRLHKAILAASCPYFEVMLFGHTNEAAMNTITLKHTPKKLFQKVVRFIYTGEFVSSGLTSQDFVEMICLAHEYQFKELLAAAITEATSLINENSSVDFVASMLNLTFIHEHKSIQEKCLDFFDRFSTTMIQNFDVFTTLSRESISSLISRDTFNASEIDIFKALKMWVEVRGNKRDDYVVFSNLRLNLISIADFNRIIRPTNFISSDTYLLALEKAAAKERMNKRVICSKHNLHMSWCEAEITKCHVKRSDGTIYQIMEAPFDGKLLKLLSDETMIIDFKKVICKMSFVELRFENANNVGGKLKLISGNDSKEVALSSTNFNGYHRYSFTEQVVDRLEFTRSSNERWYGREPLRLKVQSIVCNNNKQYYFFNSH